MKFEVLVALLPFLTAACTGNLSGTNDIGGGGEGGNADGRGNAGGETNTAGSGLIPSDDACKTSQPVIPRARLWRLSAAQYANTVSQVFGIKPDVSEFPLDGVSDDTVTKFDTNADKNLVSDQLATLYEAQAAKVAGAYVTKISADKPCILAAAPAAGCASTFFRGLGGAAFRRPLTTAELDRLVSFHDKARQAYDATVATRMTIEAILQSPNFIYRHELGSASTGSKVALTPHEVASQLSYFIADMPPDDALRKAADNNELKTFAMLSAHVERLLAIPAARQKVQTFLASYVGVKKLIDGKTKDAAKFPMFDGALRSALAVDALATAAEVTFDDGGSIDGLFTGEIELGASLTAVYGAAKRPAFMTHPAVLAALSNEATTSPVHRGLFFRRTMLCDELPPAPANATNQVEKLTDPTNVSGTQREQWAYFKKSSPSCATCHQQFHPLGLGFENYDPIGRLRDADNGKPIDLTVVADESDPQIDGTYKDAVGLGKAIAASDEGRSCFALQYTTFAFGREVPLDSEPEACRLKALVKQFAGKPLGLKDLLKAMAQEESFNYRSYP